MANENFKDDLRHNPRIICRKTRTCCGPPPGDRKGNAESHNNNGCLMKFTPEQIREMENAQALYASASGDTLLILVLPVGAYEKHFAPARKDRDEDLKDGWMKLVKNQP